MLSTPNPSSLLGYFDQLQSASISDLRALLTEISANPEGFFTTEERSYVKIGFQIQTKQQMLSPENELVTRLDDFLNAIEEKEWRQASLVLAHGMQTPNLGLKYIGAYKNEQVALSLDNVDGICQLGALFREGVDAGAYLLRLARGIGLAEKPKKASRYISEPLQTKLLCDAMHMCSVCREGGVIIHHIMPVEEGGRSVEDNLIVLCLNHHNDAHSISALAKRLRPEHLLEYKSRHLSWVNNRGSGRASIIDSNR